MPMPRRREPRRLGALLLIAAGAGALLVGAGSTGSGSGPLRLAASAWSGLVGTARPQVAVGQRMIVVLNAPSLADRVARAGGRAGDRAERRWTAGAFAAQAQLISQLATHGISVQPEFSYARVIDGFSAPLDARAVAELERSPEVAGVYPVRPAYPASVSSTLLHDPRFGPGTGHRADVALPGFDGRGVTIALLDTGVDRTQPFLRGRVQTAVDLIGEGSSGAVPRPDDPTQLELHGTEMAGILVGAGGPSGLAGVATSASVLPLRVAGWQPDATGNWAIYARTDQLVAGLERAVDPNADGDAHDAARIALVALAEPYAAFDDSPAARAVNGALKLDTLVVAPAGNDGPAGPGYGSISGPGGASSALTVGAADLRRTTDDVRLIARAGLDILLDRAVPLTGAVAPRKPLDLDLAGLVPVAKPASTGPPSRSGPALQDFFDEKGFSVVAGRAALVPAGDDPASTAENAARAGATAVILYGPGLAAGGIGLDESVGVPVVAVPTSAARAMIAAIDSGARAIFTIGALRTLVNDAAARVAPFSSRGLAFNGQVKPELAAPGVGLVTAQPGANADGTPRYGSVNGSSAAAATVAGAAALLAQMRPELDARELRSLLVGTAQTLRSEPVTAQGAGTVDVGAAAAAEYASDPATITFGRADDKAWSAMRTIVLRNLSTRPLRLAVRSEEYGASAGAVGIDAVPDRLTLARGQSARVIVLAHAVSVPPRGAPVQGALVVAGEGTQPLRVPWAVFFGSPPSGLLGSVRLSTSTFRPSDSASAIVTVRAGRLVRAARGDDVQPVSRLDVQLWTADGKPLGVLLRLRDLLPGRYAFGLTGRDPEGRRLQPGRYRLRLLAWPTSPDPATRKTIGFTIK